MNFCRDRNFTAARLRGRPSRISGRAIGAAAGELLLTRMRGEPVATRIRDVGFEIVRRPSA